MIVKLKKNGFENALTSSVGDNKIGWSTHDHANLLNSVLAALIDENENRVELTPEQKNLLLLAIAPTPELQRSSIERVFREGNMEIDQASMVVIQALVGIPQFADYLKNNDNPDTGRRYIGKSAKSGRKDTLDSLLGKPKVPVTKAAATPAAPATPAAAPLAA